MLQEMLPAAVAIPMLKAFIINGVRRIRIDLIV